MIHWLVAAFCLISGLTPQASMGRQHTVPVFDRPLDSPSCTYAISQGRRLLGEVDEWTAQVWNLRSGQRLYELPVDSGYPGRIAFSPDGRLLAVCDYHQEGPHSLRIRILEAATGRLLHTMRQEMRQLFLIPTTVIFSPDGKTLAVECDSGIVELWNYQTEKLLGALRLHGHGDQSHVGRIAFSPDGRTLVTTPEEIEFWNVATLDRTAHAAVGGIDSLAFSPDGSLLAIGTGNGSTGGASVELRDTATLALQRRLRGLGSTINHLVFSPDGSELLAINSQGLAARWKLADAKPALTFGNSGFSLSSAVAADASTVIVAGWDRYLMAYDGRSGRQIRNLSSRIVPIAAAAFSSDGKTLAAMAAFQSVSNPSSPGIDVHTRWDLRTGCLRSASVLGTVDNTVLVLPSAADLPPDSRFEMRERTTVDRIFRLLPEEFECRDWAFNPSRTLMALVGSHTASAGYPETARRVPDIYLVDVRQPKILRHQSLGGWLFLSVGFTDGGRSLIAVTRDARIWIQPLHEQHPAVSIPLKIRDWVDCASISSDGNQAVLSTSRHGDYLWKRSAGVNGFLHFPVPHDNYTRSLTLANHVPLLAATETDGSLQIWDTQNGKRVCFIPSGEHIASVSFSPDGRTMAGIDDDGAVHLFETRTGRALAKLWLITDPNSHSLYWLARTPEGSYSGSQGVERLLKWKIEDGGSRTAKPGESGQTEQEVPNPILPKESVRIVHSADGALAEIRRMAERALASKPAVTSARATTSLDPTAQLVHLLNTRNGSANPDLGMDFKRRARRFVERGADLNAMSWFGKSLLALYAETGDLAEMQWLLHRPQKITQHVLDIALLGAASSGKAAAVDLLIKASADVRDPQGKSLLHPLASPEVLGKEALNYFVSWRLRAGNAIACVLIYAGADPNACDTDGTSLLMRTLEAGYLSPVADYLVRHSARLDARNASGETPLHSAVKAGDTSSVKLLLRCRADPNAADTFGQTPLVLAVQKGLPVIMRILLDAGANPNSSGIRSDSPLSAAAHNADLSTVQFLLAHGARPADPPGYGWSALAEAVLAEDREMVKLLLRYGANVHWKDERGHTPLELLNSRDPDDIADIGKLLRHAGAE